MGANILYAIGALVLFGIFLSTSNQQLLVNTQVSEKSEYYITAVSLGQSMIDEAKSKAFDAKTVTAISVPRTALSATLGPETGESVHLPDTLTSIAPYTSSQQGYLSAVTYNDIDDYNGYSRLVNTQRTEGYKILTTVRYVSETNPAVTSLLQTYAKRFDVSVTSPYLADTVKLTYVYTY